MPAVVPFIPAIIGAGASIYSANKASKTARGQQNAANARFQQQLAMQKEQQAKLDAQKDIYKKYQFENPYANMENQYAGMENAYEDLTVSTQAADFQMEQGAQQRTNIMQGLRGAAGGSGIAGLAQSLANQGQLQARQVAAGISQQEARNQGLMAQGAMSVQQLERQGASAADMAQRKGEAMVMEAEMSRNATLLGVEYGGMAGVNTGVEAARKNQMAADVAAMQMKADRASTFGNIAGQIAGEINWGSIFGGTNPIPSLGPKQIEVNTSGPDLTPRVWPPK